MTIQVNNWSIKVTYKDSLALHGQLFGHDRINDGEYGFPSTFMEFNSETKTGIGLSGKEYVLGSFLPTGNAKTEFEALNLIKSWIEIRKK